MTGNATIYSADGAILTEGLDSAARSDQAIQLAREFARDSGEHVDIYDPDGYEQAHQRVMPSGLRVPLASDSELGELRQEAGTAGDSEQVALCDHALRGDEEARWRCSEAIAEARAADVD